MKNKFIIITLGVMALAGCATATGTPYQPSNPTGGKAKIVVYRNATSVQSPTFAQEAIVVVNGEYQCPMRRGGSLEIDVPAGKNKVQIRQHKEFQFTTLNVDAKPNKITYLNAQMVDSVFLFGTLGAKWVANANNTSLFKLELGVEKDALNTNLITCVKSSEK